MDPLINILKLIESLTLLSYGLSFALVYHVVQITKLCYSLLLSLVVLVLFNLMMFGYMEILVWWDELDSKTSQLLNFCWYIGFSLFYLAAILSIYYVHKKENIRIGRFGQGVSLLFCAAAILQLIQYTEIILFESIDRFGDIYTYGILFINITTAVICLIFAITLYYQVRYKQDGIRQVIKWSI